MFLTLNQALDKSPVEMAVIEWHYRQLIRRTPDGGYKRVMTGSSGETLPREGSPSDLERLNKLFASEHVNCRPLMEEVE